MKNISSFKYLLAVGIALLLTACTNTPKQLDETQHALSQCEKQRTQETNSLKRRIGQLQKHLEECQLSAREIISDSKAARSRETELRQLLHRELTDKSVELEYLKGRLTVRMLDKILFKSGSAHILPLGKEVLDKVAIAIAKTQDLIRVVGHTDDVRISRSLQLKYPSNWELSAARASSVVRYFQGAHGINPLRMEAVGLSKYHPLTENTDDVSRQRNRRVEIVLTARDQ